MTASGLSYALVTPARDEASNLRRLAECVARQTAAPLEWIIVENGSSDETPALAAELAREHPWIRVVTLDERGESARGGAIVRAFSAGLAALKCRPDVVVNLDADISMEADYFELLLRHFAADPSLGIASGSACELENGAWRQQFVTRGTVWGATRAYRWECLEDVSPLEERLGWDGIDEVKATVRGWRTETFLELPFRHHRPMGTRDGRASAKWAAEGRLAHYMGYRFGYLVVRSVFRAVRHAEPSALAMLRGYADAAFRREPRCPDLAARRYLRDTQRIRHLPLRAREALGRR